MRKHKRNYFLELYMYSRPTDDKINNLEDVVEKFFSNNNIQYNDNQSVDIVNICQKIGFDVITFDNSHVELEDFDGVILVDSDEKIIGVNDKLNLNDARFVIAHELSHYIWESTQKHNSITFAFRDSNIHGEKKRPLENDMDYMAAAILVPRHKLQKFLDVIGIKNIRSINQVNDKIDISTINFLANQFNVSEETITRRIIEVS